MPFLKILPLFLLLVACVPPSTGTASASATQSQSLLASPTPFPAETFIPTSTPPAVTLTSGPLVLTIYSPEDNAIVFEPLVNVSGEVSTEVTLTLNDNIYVVPAGTFSQAVALEEGPNIIEVIASDMDGNVVDLILTVTYQP